MKDHDPIDALLSVEDAYLHDDGFSQRVVATLPARRRSWATALPACTIAATGLASAVLLPWNTLWQAWVQLGPAALSTPAALCVGAAAAVLVTAAAGLASER